MIIKETPDNYKIEKQYEAFRNTGLLWFINSILHVFGWALHIEFDDDEDNIINMYPQRRGFRGFSEDINSNGYEKIAKYLKDNSSDLFEEFQINK